MFKTLKIRGFEIQSINHAEAIIGTDFPEAVAEIEGALLGLSLPISEIVGSGGGETKITQRLRRALAGTKWPKHNFEIKKTVDGVVKESITHEIDHVRNFDNGTFALEIEWNNKDPFFDRDLENFKRLHAEGVISVASIITRGSSMQNEMLSRFEQFAADNGIHSFADLERLEIDPTPKHRSYIQKAIIYFANTVDAVDLTRLFCALWPCPPNVRQANHLSERGQLPHPLRHLPPAYRLHRRA